MRCLKRPGSRPARAPRAGLSPVYLAYALSGAASLSFEVLWSRLLAMALGATVYAFGLVLGVFLLGLGIGGVVGASVAPRLRRPRWSFATLQLWIAVAVSLTAVWVALRTILVRPIR